jgi:D-alanyl-D-alanine carboxypeptidase/D-alanyl-D-alanine-endopeptidase (penicillin-binding protein 4)
MNAVRRTAPPGEDTLAAVSRSLDTVLAVINKESDNLSAELLLKTIAAERVPGPGSARAGLAVVKEYLAGVGIDTSRMILADGSGVSWYTAVSPEALTALLRAEYGQGQTYPRFRASLSVAGVDGKLRNRMKGSRAEGNAAAKTGTLSGVGCLSGYVASADGRTLAFSILGNHFPGEGAVLRSLQNTIVALLARTDVAGGR